MKLNQGIGRIFLDIEAFPSFGSTLASIRWVRALELERARIVLVYDLEKTKLRNAPEHEPKTVALIAALGTAGTGYQG